MLGQGISNQFKKLTVSQQNIGDLWRARQGREQFVWQKLAYRWVWVNKLSTGIWKIPNIVLKTSVTKCWKHVPPAVPKSMCHRISSVMGFGTANF